MTIFPKSNFHPHVFSAKWKDVAPNRQYGFTISSSCFGFALLFSSSFDNASHTRFSVSIIPSRYSYLDTSPQSSFLHVTLVGRDASHFLEKSNSSRSYKEGFSYVTCMLTLFLYYAWMLNVHKYLQVMHNATESFHVRSGVKLSSFACFSFKMVILVGGYNQSCTEAGVRLVTLSVSVVVQTDK